MTTAAPEPALSRLLAWPRIRFTLLAALPFGLMLSLPSTTSVTIWLVRVSIVALAAMLAFGLFESWPTRLPHWLARWVLQLLGMVFAVPFAAALAYWVTTPGDAQFWTSPPRLIGFAQLVILGMWVGPWVAFGALVRQRDAFVRDQALRFQLERSELERQASDARLRLLQAQVQPHFLFNTLANVRALVNAGSPRASAVLDSLIAYLRAAVPQLEEPSTTLAQELQLVRAYLELMHIRMPDRLRFDVRCDDAAAGIACPPMAVLTLVENAVRHGIDPSEEGGRIAVTAELRGDGRCLVLVADTGVGLQRAGSGLGTGLSTLRERLQLAFGGAALLRLAENPPHGVRAEIEFPAQRSPA
jgi:signal transduction histidine kinase